MTLSAGHAKNADQIAYWNGAAGDRWRNRQDMQDRLLAPISALAIARANPRQGERIIDIGCGCGATTRELAGRVGASGHVLGVDISEPMLGRARQLAPADAPLEFVLADATTYPFKPGAADLLFSRFGVMFFAEPAVSFANMRTGLRNGGRLTFVCWREPKENPWLILPLQAVYRHVPKLPQLGPDDPGPFSFASQERVRRILHDAGFTGIAMEPHDLSLDISGGKGLDAAVKAALEIGPANLALEGQPPETRAAATQSIREALTPFARNDAVPLKAAIWIVSASVP
jgi:ubiquinone/menaquinone biosynthesis C-methylase UbiE